MLVKEILVSMKAMQLFFPEIMFASFLRRCGELLCYKCFVRVLCKEYHAIECVKQNVLV